MSAENVATQIKQWIDFLREEQRQIKQIESAIESVKKYTSTDDTTFRIDVMNRDVLVQSTAYLSFLESQLKVKQKQVEEMSVKLNAIGSLIGLAE